jgi:photosystem II stability/assembly factor-like uncharacterized protein
MALAQTNPDIIYVGTSHGVFKTINGGADWQKVRLSATSIRSIQIAPGNSDIVYAGTYRDGIYKSEDGGRTWIPRNGVSEILSGQQVNAIAIDPKASNIVYVGTGYELGFYPGEQPGIYKSTNGGETWIKKYSAEDAVTTLLVDTNNSLYIYAGEYLLGQDFILKKSTDGGEIWVSKTVDPSASSGDVVALAMTPAGYNSPTIYAICAGYFASSGRDVYKSTDNGDSWTPKYAPSISRYPPYALAVDPNKPLTVYAGSSRYVYKSTNGGDTWSVKTNGLPDAAIYPSSIAINSQNSDILHVGLSQAGLYASTDGAESWRLSSLYNTNVKAVAVHPIASKTAVAAVEGHGYHVAVTNDGGNSWNYLEGSPTNLGAVSIDPQNPETIWVGDVYHFAKQFYVHKSTDGGQNWDHFQLNNCTGGCDSGISDILINKHSSDKILVGMDGFGLLSGWLQRSIDGGITWDGIPSWPSTALAADPNDPNVVYTGKRRIGEIFLYINVWEDEIGWTEITPESGIGDVRDIEVDSKSRVYVAASDGLRRWDSFVWTKLNGLPTSDITALAIDRSVNPEIVYVGTGEDGVFASQDGGLTWMSFSEGLGNLSITKLSLSKSQPKILYAGTTYGGVWSRKLTAPLAMPWVQLLLLSSMIW